MGLHTSRHTRKNSSFLTQEEHLVLLGLEALPDVPNLCYATCSKLGLPWQFHQVSQGVRNIVTLKSQFDRHLA